ncbi:MAG TPA: hypothetical protein DE036_02915 [Actinobacteria bacterium]|nr:hypothetical protein [Actinomycetota bacterium]
MVKPEMNDKTKLAIVKIVHTIIYITMVAAIFYILYAGISETYDNLLYFSLGLLAIEGIVFFGNRMRCPLTDLAKKYGDPKGYVGDTFLPERFTKYTFRLFGTILAIGLIILLINYLRT